MTFLTGGLAVAGAVAVLIPILIHLLLRRRRQPVPWAAMQFLMQAIKRQRRRLQIEQWLLLAARCMIVLLAGLALARPVLEEAMAQFSGGRGSRQIVLVIDNSLASTLRDADGMTALDRDLAAARNVVEDLGPGDAVSIITAARPAAAIIDPPSTNLTAVLGVIDELNPSLTPADLPRALAIANDVVGRRTSPYRSAAVYVMSDFRAGSANLDEQIGSLPNLAEPGVVLVASPPATTTATNTQVVAVEPVRSVVLSGEALSDQVLVRLKRHGGELGADVSRLRLLAGGSPLAEPRVIEWDAGASEAETQFVVTLPRQTDRHIALSAAIDQDALAADDARYTIVEARRQLRVAMLARRDFGFDRTIDQLTPAQWINRALTPREDSQLQVVEVDPTALDARDLTGADIAFLPHPDLLQSEGWPVLRQFVDAGGVLVIAPPEDQTIHPWTTNVRDVLGMPWRIGVERIDLAEPEMLAAEQPRSTVLRLLGSELSTLAPAVGVMQRLDVTGEAAKADALLVTDSGAPFVLAGSPQDMEPSARDAASQASNGEHAKQQSQSRGLVVLFASAPHLEWTTLPAKPLMVPLVQEIVRQGVSVIRSQQEAVVGQPVVAWLPRSAASIASPSGAVQPVRLDNTGSASVQMTEPGIARVLDASGQEVSAFAVNVEPSAGRTEVQSEAQVASWLNAGLGEGRTWSFITPGETPGELRTASSGLHLAGILLLAVLALVLLETLMARRFSHAVRSSRGLESEGIQPAVAGKHGMVRVTALAGGGHDAE